MSRLQPFVALVLLLLWAAAQSADFNGDGKADLLWRLPAGNPLIWEMSGLSVQRELSVPAARDAGSAIAGAGKFFGKSSPDAILWIDSSDQLTLWQIASDGSLEHSCTPINSIDPNLHFLGIGDVDGDGTDDVLWRNATDNTITALLMDGCDAPVTAPQTNTADPAWVFAGIGDLNGDGKADLLWLDSATNNLVEWLQDTRGSIKQQILPLGGQAGWQIAAVADFDGDGTIDILWRSPSGANLILWSTLATTPTVTAVTTTATGLSLDTIFGGSFDPPPSPSLFTLTPDLTILAAPDLDGDGRADLVVTDSHGNVGLLQMKGATVQRTRLVPAEPDMPLPGLTGWRLPLDRPTVTKAAGEITIDWNLLSGSPQYTVYASAINQPASTGTAIPSTAPPFSFQRTAPGYADKRYFGVSANYHGMTLPSSKEAYIVEFTPIITPVWGFLSVTDLNNDGCPDVFRVLGDCHGNFAWADVYSTGLAALDTGTVRDARMADFNGDGIADIIANVYSCDSDACGGATSDRIMLFLGNGDGTYTQSLTFNADGSFGGGYGETIVTADFNNDGCLDLFLPRYTYYDPAAHNLLLINDCHGNFTDVADAAGVAMRSTNEFLRPEGAQALDINGDGWIDLYTAGALFINNGNLTFTNVGNVSDASGVTSYSPWNVPATFDEGAKFIDCDNSGQPCLAINAIDALRIFKFDGISNFSELAVIPPIYMNQSWGLTAADIDGDGRTDLVVAGGIDQSIELNPAYSRLRQRIDAASAEEGLDLDDILNTQQTPNALPQLLVNRGNQFVVHDFYQDGLTPATRPANNLLTFGDFDLSGTVDVVSMSTSVSMIMNNASSPDIITISVLGANGEQNQQGRVVRVMPKARPNLTMLQIVDGGSGYMSNGPYELAFATPYFGAYTISVRFADATYTVIARSGDHVTMRANGTADVQPHQ